MLLVKVFFSSNFATMELQQFAASKSKTQQQLAQGNKQHMELNKYLASSTIPECVLMQQLLILLYSGQEQGSLDGLMKCSRERSG